MAEGATKLDDLHPFPVKDQLPGVHYCVSSPPPWPEAILLGFQHYIVMLGTTVMIATIIVPLMGGGNVEKAEVVNTLLFVAGINTLLQTCFGTRLPVVIGGSYTFIIPTISIALSSKYNASVDPHQRFKESMRSLQGALIIGSFLPMVIGFFGFWRIFARFLSPLAASPLVILTGLGLYAHGFPQRKIAVWSLYTSILVESLYNFLNSLHFQQLVFYELYSQQISFLSFAYIFSVALLADCVEVGLPALILVVLFSQYAPHHHSLKSRGSIFARFGVLFTIAIVWTYVEILTVAKAYDDRPAATQTSCRSDRSGLISGAPWIKVPYPFQWGRPSFNAGNAFAMMTASFVSVVESTGVYIAASRYGSATPIPPCVLSRGIGWQGVGILLDGLFGTGNGSTASVENAGLLGLTQVGSRRVIEISVAFMLFFSVLGKFGAVIASIPLPIVAALYCVLFAYVCSAGIGLLPFCNLHSFRTKFILGFSLFMGLSVPQYFNQGVFNYGHGPVHTHSTWFNDTMQVIFTSPATVAIIVAFFLDCTHSIGQSSSRNDSGHHWWKKFRSFDSDSRSAEFYSLPCDLNRFFPSS